MLLLFLAICQILNMYNTLTISHLSYIAIIHKAMLVSWQKVKQNVKALDRLFLEGNVIAYVCKGGACAQSSRC